MAQRARVRQHLLKKERLEARVTRDQKRLIERAAELRGTTMTDFVVASAQEAAAKTIRDFESLTLREEAREVFLQAVVNPATPNEAARAAAQRHREQMGL
jgi:uncharacterized protein (DUF1778 family)